MCVRAYVRRDEKEYLSSIQSGPLLLHTYDGLLSKTSALLNIEIIGLEIDGGGGGGGGGCCSVVYNIRFLIRRSIIVGWM